VDFGAAWRNGPVLSLGSFGAWTRYRDRGLPRRHRCSGASGAGHDALAGGVELVGAPVATPVSMTWLTRVTNRLPRKTSLWAPLP